MPKKEFSERLKKFKAKFPAGESDNMSIVAPEYSEQLKRIKAKFAALVGGNFAFKKILRPYMRLITDFNSGLILEFKNACYDDFADSEKYPLGTEFDAAIPVSRTAVEQMERVKNLQLLYTKVRGFSFAENLSDAEKKTLSRYVACLSDTVPVDLLNFCKETEPKFFAWIDAICAHR